MGLAKLIILVELKGIGLPFVPLVEAMFNPSQLRINQTSNWHSYGGAKDGSSAMAWTDKAPASLSLDLLFDTYESGLDVRLYTQRVAALMEVRSELGRPPRCHLVWGRFGIVFQGVLQSLNQSFTLFQADGTPARATLGCTFQELRDVDMRILAALQPLATGIKAHTLQRGESLSSVAAREYNDPAQWRRIAEANKIDNPLKLLPGASLVVPPQRPRRIRQR